jgi:hypothetical protein
VPGEAVEVDIRSHDNPALDSHRGDPMRRGADEPSACEIVIDRLAQPIDRAERADDEVVAEREVVARDDAAADRIAVIIELIGDRARGHRGV